MRRVQIAPIAAICAAVIALAGCGGSSAASSTTGSKSVITVYGCEPQNKLITTNTNETCGGNPMGMMYAGLTAYTADGETKNEVAKSITSSADNTEYDIKLKDWKFSNGQPVKAENFTKAWSYGANASNAQVSSNFFSMIDGYSDLQKKGVSKTAQLSGLKVVNDKEFTVKLNAPTSTFKQQLGYLAFSPLPDSFFKNPSAFGNNPIGDGPYAFQNWTHNQSITMVRNKYYHGMCQAQNASLTFKIYTSTDSAYADVQSGNLDAMDSIPAADRRAFRTDKSVKGYVEPGSNIFELAILSNEPHWQTSTQEGRLRRQALSMASNREQIITTGNYNLGVPATDFAAPKIPGHTDTRSLQGSDVLAYNPAKAKQLWAQANSLSKWDNSKTLQFYYSADGGSQGLFAALANQVKNTLGIKTRPVAIATFSQYSDMVSQSKIHGVMMSSWQADYPSIENYLKPMFSSAAADGRGSNSSNYKNPEFDSLLDQAARSQDGAQAIKLYQQAEEILFRDLPMIPIYNQDSTGVTTPSIKGYDMNWQSLIIYTQLHR